MILGAAAPWARPAEAPTVNADSTPVYSGTSTSSPVLQKLSKGAPVAIEYSVVTREGEWCSLSSPARGYVLCGYLKRGEAPQRETADAPVPPVLTPAPAGHAPLLRVAVAVPKTPAVPPAAEPAMFTPEQSALMSAARVGGAAAVQLALAKGALVDGRDKDGKTALMWAAYMGRTEAVTELLKEGADVNATDNSGWTAIAGAVFARRPEALQLLLAQGPALNPHDNEGRTPLMHAAQYGDLVMIRDLLAKGGDPNARNRFEQTPLMFAVALPEPAAAELLLAAGADANAMDAAGRSVLINAVLAGAERTANVQLLLKARVDLNTKDKEGRTALAWAKNKGYAAIEKLLKKAGAVEW